MSARDQIKHTVKASWEAASAGEEDTARITRVTLDSTSNLLREAAKTRAGNPLRDAIVTALTNVDVGEGYVPHRLTSEQVERLIAPEVLNVIAAELDT